MVSNIFTFNYGGYLEYKNALINEIRAYDIIIKLNESMSELLILKKASKAQEKLSGSTMVFRASKESAVDELLEVTYPVYLITL